jgi:uncharacterized protein (TIGR03435 family)
MGWIRNCGWALPVLAVIWPGGAAAQAQNNPGDAATKAAKFEVASVRLMEDRDKLPLEQQMFAMSPSGAGEFTVRNARLANLIEMAYDGVHSDTQIAGKPAWFDSSYYEVAAKPERDVGLSYEQLKPYLQELLRDRLHLAFHWETKDTKGYALVAAGGGPKLKATNGSKPYAYVMPSRIDAVGMSLDGLATMLAIPLGEPVEDRTGLKGNFDLRLDYAPLEATDSSLPSIYTALKEQLGLKLEKAKVTVKMFVIDHVDRVPTEN